jgi:hypothetical protein
MASCAAGSAGRAGRAWKTAEVEYAPSPSADQSLTVLSAEQETSAPWSPRNRTPAGARAMHPGHRQADDRLPGVERCGFGRGAASLRSAAGQEGALRNR